MKEELIRILNQLLIIIEGCMDFEMEEQVKYNKNKYENFTELALRLGIFSKEEFREYTEKCLEIVYPDVYE